MNDNKYYTPSLEEFHAGFRYEGYSKSTYDGKTTTYDWEKRIFKGGHKIYNGDEFVIPDNTRVKFLNRDDIEELGWTYMGKHWFYHEDEYYRMDNDEFGAYYIHVHHPADSFGEITILYGDLEWYSLEGSVRKFDGAIRNYNDLKTIMKWAGIK